MNDIVMLLDMWITECSLVQHSLKMNKIYWKIASVSNLHVKWAYFYVSMFILSRTCVE